MKQQPWIFYLLLVDILLQSALLVRLCQLRSTINVSCVPMIVQDTDTEPFEQLPVVEKGGPLL